MKRTPTWTNNGELNRWAGGPWDSFDGSDPWDDVKGFIDDQYDADSGLAVDAARPHAWTIGAAGTNFTGTTMQKLYAYGKLTGLPTLYASSKTFFAKCAITSSGITEEGHYEVSFTGSSAHTDVEFDGGSNGLAMNAFSAWHTEPAGNDDEIITSTPCGSGKSPKPAWSDEPEFDHDHGGPLLHIPVDKYKGHVVTGEVAILKFDVPGGFTKV
jgi:hypothetical protein